MKVLAKNYEKTTRAMMKARGGVSSAMGNLDIGVNSMLVKKTYAIAGPERVMAILPSNENTPPQIAANATSAQLSITTLSPPHTAAQKFVSFMVI